MTEAIQTKICTKCGEEKPLHSFTVRKDSKDGRYWQCKTCQRSIYLEWNLNNPGVRSKNAKDWYNRNKEKAKASAERWNSKNPDKAKEIRFQWKAKNPDRVKRYKREWNKKNIERQRRWVRESYLKASRNLSDSYLKVVSKGRVCPITLDQLRNSIQIKRTRKFFLTLGAASQLNNINTTQENPMINLNDKIKQLTSLIEGGVEKWIEAGKLLIEMEAEDPKILEVISKKNRILTMDRLKMFKRIGSGDLNPYLLLDASPGAQRLAEMSRKDQDKYSKEPIEIAVLVGDQIRLEKKPVEELTRLESDVAFNATRLRSTGEQVEMIRNRMAARQVKGKLRYIIDGEKITFLANSTFTADQLREVLDKIPKPTGKELERAIQKNQIAKS